LSQRPASNHRRLRARRPDRDAALVGKVDGWHWSAAIRESGIAEV
jgi:hypothetical protein